MGTLKKNELILEETRNSKNFYPVAVINPWDISEYEVKWIIKN